MVAEFLAGVLVTLVVVSVVALAHKRRRTVVKLTGTATVLLSQVTQASRLHRSEVRTLVPGNTLTVDSPASNIVIYSRIPWPEDDHHG